MLKKDILTSLMNNTRILSYQNEVKRKKFHLMSSLLPIYYYFLPESIIMFSLFLFLSVLSIDIYRMKFNKIPNIPFVKNIKNTIRPYEENNFMSATLLCFTAFVIIIIFEMQIAITSLFIASISDTCAALYGQKYGKIKLFYNKTLEGSYAFFISSMSLIYILLTFNVVDIDLTYLLIVSLTATIVESLTPTKLDNMSVPICVSLSMFLFINL
ncbi:MAG: hypothetical protein CMG61_01160 [Candidatus Marinimicrobia bacterium]|nr:hypothetical protein [Candidatus Neomarinimicrobiota bacterium]|tara:strand:- start:2880 stop:3518 length:639 start_codon:yes stop_codon:yes gene_type:complete